MISAAGFRKLTHFAQKGYEDVLNDPTRIFNCDESAFLLAPKENCVLASKGAKAVYNTSNNDEKECLTSLIMLNAKFLAKFENTKIYIMFGSM